jgi:1,4-alpha-glucan branching enzyme
MWGHPGKKLLFMGGEFAQRREWNHDNSLDWHLLQYDSHQGVQRLVRDLNRLYTSLPALYQRDCEPGGFQWLKVDEEALSVFAWLRRGEAGQIVLVVCNFTPTVHHEFRIGVPVAGFYRERLNTDSGLYWGGNLGNSGGVAATAEPCDGEPYSVSILLPPLATLIFEPAEELSE